ncbi:hypothetical protein HUJ05_013074 [Dendroctonus ponderosae]|nr:hypothetical protein HUJ05_013074 [Dendroctonus ponderosae]
MQANCENYLQKDKNKKQEWITQEILDMMDERRKHEEVWKSYVDLLFASERSKEHNMNEIDTGPPIMKSETEKAILSFKNDKAPGPDSIQVERLKLMCETDNQFLDILTSLFNDIYNRGEIPNEWLESTFIALPKTQNGKTSDQHRLISLINHITKVFTKIIHNRIIQ